MRRIAQKGVRAPQVNKAAKAAKASMAKKYRTGGMKKAQTGTQYTSSKADQKEIEERQKYFDRIINTNRPDTLTARSRYIPGMTERQERNQILLDRTKKVEADMKARGIGNRRNGGKSVKKAQLGNKLPGAKPYGEAMKDSTLKKALQKKYAAKPKAKYGAAKKASSKRYK